MSNAHLYLERCGKTQPHEQHTWIGHVIAEGEQGDALMWVEPHLCLGHERIIALEIVDDDEQPHYEPAEAAAIPKFNVEFKVGNYMGDADDYQSLLSNARKTLGRHIAAAPGEDGRSWLIGATAALGLTAALFGGVALGNWFGWWAL